LAAAGEFGLLFGLGSGLGALRRLSVASWTALPFYSSSFFSFLALSSFLSSLAFFPFFAAFALARFGSFSFFALPTFAFAPSFFC